MTDEQISATIETYLNGVIGPGGTPLKNQGRIQNIKFACGRVQVDILSRGLEVADKRQLDTTLYEGLLALEGVTDVVINMVNPDTAAAPTNAPAAPAQGATGSPPRQAPAAAGPGLPQKRAVPGVKHVIAVASGKGGVGKSTVSVNLALALQKQGHRVGLLDADCYGPSIPLMLGIDADEKPRVTETRKISPIRKWDIDVMSIGFFVERDSAVIWRGLMVTKALQQFFFDVAWQEIDYLIIDLPPGTGDTQLTMVQNIVVHGAVIVSTPQDVALADARKGIAMFRETQVPILGVIENMSYFACPHCGERTEIFSRGGARKTAEVLGVPFLGEIPLEVALRETSDAGTPYMAGATDGATYDAFMHAAEAAVERAAELEPQGA